MKTYSLESAAKELNVSPRTVAREVHDGLLPIIQIRGRSLILEEDLQQYLEKKRRYVEQTHLEAH